MSAETQTQQSRKIPVSTRAALQRINRALWRGGRRVVRSRSRGEKQLGEFLLLDGNNIVTGWQDSCHFEDFAREQGKLAPYEYIAN